MKKKIAIVTGLLLALIAGLVTAGVRPASGIDKVTICHAAGQAGTIKFVTLELPPAALSAHFDQNGTPQAGHELDYFGACRTDTTSTGTTETMTTETMTTETIPPPPPPPCVPRNPDGSPGGKDGIPGNDDCAADPVPPLKPPITTSTDTTTTTGTTTETETTETTETSTIPNPPVPKVKKPVVKGHKAKIGTAFHTTYKGKRKPPPLCPPGKPAQGRCSVQGSG